MLKAFNEVEHPAWREYDEAYGEKMASTGEKVWSGIDVALYQELCASRQKLQTSQKAPKGPSRKRPVSGRGNVCWLYNDSLHAHPLQIPPHM